MPLYIVHIPSLGTPPPPTLGASRCLCSPAPTPLHATKLLNFAKGAKIRRSQFNLSKNKTQLPTHTAAGAGAGAKQVIVDHTTSYPTIDPQQS